VQTTYLLAEDFGTFFLALVNEQVYLKEAITGTIIQIAEAHDAGSDSRNCKRGFEVQYLPELSLCY
jgi:hypothetical protein